MTFRRLLNFDEWHFQTFFVLTQRPSLSEPSNPFAAIVTLLSDSTSAIKANHQNQVLKLKRGFFWCLSTLEIVIIDI